MAASTISRATWTNDTGTAANPVGDGTILSNTRLQDDIYAKIDEMFAGAGAYATFTLGGLVAAEGFGTHLFSAGGTGANLFRIRNTTAGTGNRGLLEAVSDTVTAQLAAYSSTWTTSTYQVQSGVSLLSDGSGGVSFVTNHASGEMRFYTGGTTLRWTVNTSGHLIPGADATYDIGNSTTGTVRNIYGQLISVDDGTAVNPSFAFTNDLNNGLFLATTDSVGVATAGVERLRFGSAGALFVNDTSNANMTIGLTINQGAATNEILALKSSEVAHGMTDLAETDTYALLKKSSGVSGGVLFESYDEGSTGMRLRSFVTTADATKSTLGVGAIHLYSSLKSGTTATSLGANTNLVVIQDAGTTRFIFDAEGSGHADVEWIAFDRYDDGPLLAALNTLAPSRAQRLKDGFGGWLQYHRRDLLQAGIVDCFHTELGRPHAMVNFTRLAMLHTGAIVQQGEQMRRLDARLAALEQAA